MEKEIKKVIKSVSINYADGSKEDLGTYALVGQDGGAWYSVVSSPARNEDKIHFNNLVVELSEALRKSLKS